MSVNNELINYSIRNSKGNFVGFYSFYLSHSQIWIPPKDGFFIIGPVDKPLSIIYKFLPPEATTIFESKLDHFRLIEELKSSGWKKKDWKYENNPKKHHLIADFIKLARDKISFKDIESFIRCWGPLWICEEHSIDKYYPERAFPCIWWPPTFQKPSVIKIRTNGGIGKYFRGEKIISHCKWRPMEEVYWYVRSAKCIKLILSINQNIVDELLSPSRFKKALHFFKENYGDNIQPMKLWENLQEIIKPIYSIPDPIPSNPNDQKNLLLFLIDKLLKNYHANNISIKLITNKKKIEPRLKYDTGWGFFGAVLMELAAFITGDYALHYCAHCHEPILPASRERACKNGQDNYCSNECRANRK